MQRKSILIIFAMLASSCSVPPVQPQQSALLTNPGPETLLEIEHTLSTAMNGINVTLAPDVLTKTSVLVIERGMQRGINRPAELGRDLGQPYHFQLVINGQQCLLVDQQNGANWPLVNAECEKE